MAAVVTLFVYIRVYVGVFSVVFSGACPLSPVGFACCCRAMNCFWSVYVLVGGFLVFYPAIVPCPLSPVGFSLLSQEAFGSFALLLMVFPFNSFLGDTWSAWIQHFFSVMIVSLSLIHI